MKAIILAAGEGTRLRPLTADRPKAMVPYRGRPILDYEIEALSACGVNDIVVVTGYCAGAVERPGIRTAHNAEFATTNMVWSLFCAEPELDDDLIISYGDIVYGPSIVRALIAAPHPFATTIDLDWRRLWAARMEDPLTDAETLKLGSDGRIIEIGRKPTSYDDIHGQYMGLIKIERSFLHRVRTFYHSMDRHRTYDGKPFERMFMTSFLQALIDDGCVLTAVPIRGGWLEIDNLPDLEVSVDLS